MPDKIVNHFVMADGSTAKYDAGSLLNLDETVSLAGYAPDAKAVGDRLTDVENLAETLNEGGLELKDEVLAENVSDWLNEHPEATTTVEDGALTQSKFSNSLDARKPSFYSTVSEMQEDEQYRLGSTAISDGAVYTVRSAVEVNDPEDMVDPSVLYKYDGQYYHGGLTENDRQVATGYECVNGFALFVAEYKNAYVTPEMFGFMGTDADKLEYAINNTPNGGVLCIDRIYTLNRNITITKRSSIQRITVIGIGKTAGISAGNYFISGSIAHNTGNITWNNINFTGTNIFDSDYLIRQYFINCIFNGTGSVVFSNTNTSTSYAQTYYFIRCVIRQSSNYIINLPADTYNSTKLYDIRFSHCLIEWCTSGIVKNNSYIGVYFDNCCIEGFNTTDPLFTGMRDGMMFKVSNCYFESNNTTYFDFSNFTVVNPFMFEFVANAVQEFTPCIVFKTGSVNAYGTSNFLITDNTFYTTQQHANELIVIDATAATQELTTWNIYNNQNHNNYAKMVEDPNDRLVVNDSFNSTVTNLISDYGLINKKRGETLTFYVFVTAAALSTTQLSIPITFPFITKDAYYSVEVTSVYVTNIGSMNVEKTAVTGSKYATGFDLRYNDPDTVNFTTNRPYNVRVGIAITF